MRQSQMLMASHVALAQVMKRVERRPMPMGVHHKPPPHSQRQPLQPLPQDGDETVPLINGGLAAKAMEGPPEHRAVPQPPACQGEPYIAPHLFQIGACLCDCLDRGPA